MVVLRPTPCVLARGAVLLVPGSAAVWAVWSLCLDPARTLAGEVLTRGPGAVGRLPFEQVLAGCAAVALLGCALWLSAMAALAVLTHIVASVGATASMLCDVTERLCPGVVRATVATALGVGVTVAVPAPAPADPPGGGGPASELSGLRLPDRTLGGPPPTRQRAARARRQHTVVVRAGDSLWSITAALLPDRATDRDITDGWHRVYRANRARIGPDPDRIVAGTPLAVPSLVSINERTTREHARAPSRRSGPPATRTG